MLRPRSNPWRYLPAVVGAFAATVTTGSVASAQIVQGRVLDSNNRSPIVLARVGLMDASMAMVDQTMTEEDGFFQLHAPGEGDYYLVADRLGYQPKVDGILEMRDGGRITVDFFIAPKAIELEGLTITAQRQLAQEQLRERGFFEREGRGFGHFLDPEEIERRNATEPADLLRGIPRVLVTEDNLFGGQVYFRGGLDGRCVPLVLVNGLRVLRGTPLEEVVAVEDIIGVEAYVGTASAPLQYLVDSNCGVLMIWTG